MANGWFTAGIENVYNGNIAWLTDTFRLIGVDHVDDTPVLATDNALDDILAGARVFTSNALAGKTNVGGVLDADDLQISAVSGDPFESLVLYKSTGTENNSWLFIYWDTLTGLPFTPAGTDVLIIWDNGSNKIMAG